MAKDIKAVARIGTNTRILVAIAAAAVVAGLAFSGLALSNLKLNQNFKFSRIGPKRATITNGTNQDFGKFFLNQNLSEYVRLDRIVFNTKVKKVKGLDIRKNVQNLTLLAQPANCGYGSCPTYFLAQAAAINKDGRLVFADLYWWLPGKTKWNILLKGDVSGFNGAKAELEFYVKSNNDIAATIITGKGGYGYPSPEKVIHPNTSGARTGTRLIFQDGYGYK